MIQRSFTELAGMAVRPGEIGSYSNSPLGPLIGLHTHDGGESVHVVVSGTKIAEVYSNHVRPMFREDALTEFQAKIFAQLPKSPSLKDDLRTLVQAIPEEQQGEATLGASERLFNFIEGT